MAYAYIELFGFPYVPPPLLTSKLFTFATELSLSYQCSVANHERVRYITLTKG